MTGFMFRQGPGGITKRSEFRTRFARRMKEFMLHHDDDDVLVLFGSGFVYLGNYANGCNYVVASEARAFFEDRALFCV